MNAIIPSQSWYLKFGSLGCSHTKVVIIDASELFYAENPRSGITESTGVDRLAHSIIELLCYFTI